MKKQLFLFLKNYQMTCLKKSATIKIVFRQAGMVKLVDTSDLGSDGESCGGSNPSTRTNNF